MEASSFELSEACRVIFGPDGARPADFLAAPGTGLAGLKRAYRRRVMETHPDRAATLGARAADLKGRFQQVQRSYEILVDFAEGRVRLQAVSAPVWTPAPPPRRATRAAQPPPPPPPRSSRPAAGMPRTDWTVADHFYRGRLPSRQLPLGQFLYYRGLISWRTLVESVAWQRARRPLVGQIALSWGLLDEWGVRAVLDGRSPGERFAACALRLGLISSFERLALVGRQRMLQDPLGEFFVVRGMMDRGRLEALLAEQRRHNGDHASWTR